MKCSPADRITARFSSYAKSFYTEDAFVHENIVLKEEHTFRVCAFSEMISRSLGLDERETATAYLCALLHDVGRFEQFTRYRTFRDLHSENHADIGLRVIDQQKFLETLETHDRKVVIEAVANHNRYSIDEALNERETLHAKIVRDADKLDIIDLHLDYFSTRHAEQKKGLEASFPDTEGFSEEIVALILQSCLVSNALRKNYNDFKLLMLAWLLDLNFPPSNRFALENFFVSRIITHLPEHELIVQAGSHVENVLREKAKQG